jgi:hypothetical protein
VARSRDVTEGHAMSQRQPYPSSEYVWGVQEIGNYINAKKRKTQYLIETGKIRVKHVGPKTIVAKKSQLDEDLSSETT